MPRSGRGGKRVGKPGQAYQNRSDLNQAPSAAPGQTYGVAAQQLRAQQQVPLPKQGSPPPAPVGSAPAGGPPSQPAGAAPLVPPGALGPLNAPTGRPNEPITAGLSTGPGPGPEAIGNPQDPTLYMLKGILARYPSPDLQALVNEAENR